MNITPKKQMTEKEYLEMVINYCKPLRNECIRKDFDAQLEGYTYKSVVREADNEWIAYFEGVNGSRIRLTISPNEFSMLKMTETTNERIALEENFVITHELLDRRENGIVYSKIQKQFTHSNRFKQLVLTDLVEQRFTFTEAKINSLYRNVNLFEETDFDKLGFDELFIKIGILDYLIDFKANSDYYSEFSTHMNYYVDGESGRKIKDNIYPTRTYLNGEDVSKIFDVDGPDKIYRIYDLYRGIINPRNEKDIRDIHLGLLTTEVFNFRDLKGINKQENALVGAPLLNVSNRYINYLKKFFKREFGYRGKIKLDRDSMLLAITTLNPERAETPLTEDDITSRQTDELPPRESEGFLSRTLKRFNKK